jgi:hypothetical protein
MVNSAKNKGDKAELELQGILRHLLGLPRIRRALGAGRRDDVGDINEVPHTVIQVTWREDLSAAITQKLTEVEEQRLNARKLFSAVFVRRSRNSVPWIVVMTPQMWAKMYRYAEKGIAVTREEKKTKMISRGRQSRGSA